RHLDDVAVQISVTGLRGGHSGVDIHEGRANAIAVLIGLLTAKEVDLEGVRLASCDGGGRVNAIAPSARSVLWCTRARVRELARGIEAAARRIAESFASVDPDLIVQFAELSERDSVPAPVSPLTGRAILEAMRTQRDGVLAWSPVIPGLVETSNNLGVLTTVGDEIRLVAMARSSKAGALEAFQERCERTLEASGARFEYRHAFPGWEAKLDTSLLRTALASYAALFGHEPKLE